MPDDGVLVECLSCNQRDEADSAEDINTDGAWRCPHCNHGVASAVREGDRAP